METAICRHIKTNGLQCKSPALTEGLYCFFHTRFYERHSCFRHTPATRGYLIPGRDIELTALEDRESVQIALSVVINALATGQIETKRATALLYGLQLASMNSANLQLKPYAPDVIRTIDSSPEGLDLAEPGTLVDITPDDLTNYKDPDDEDEDDDQE